MTALIDMAAPARPPGIGDARVPCPLCGGLIHPVAGRCKHCKEDLTSFRAGRPQAAAALPALNGHHAQSNGHVQLAQAAVASAPIPVAIPARESSQPILPPRPTGRSMQAQQQRPMWKSWPMVVIVLAVIAIVGAVVIMVWPSDQKDNGKRLLGPPPAPDRMQTDPLQKPGPQGQLDDDPWGGGGGANPSPRPADPPPQPQAPAIPDPDDDDIYGGLGGGGGTGGLGGSAVMLAVFDRACAKLKQCPDVDQSMISTMCDQFAALPKPPVPQNCPSAKRCLDAIDSMSCTQAGNNNPFTTIYLLTDCASALKDC